MNNKRLTIIPEMIPYIVKKYDEYYNKTTHKKIKDIGVELNIIFTDLFKTEYNFDESAYRKTYKNIKAGIDISLKNNFADDEIERIAQARTKLQFEKRISKKERQEANSVINRYADNMLIKEALVETINSYSYNEFININGKIQKNEDHMAIYVFSDTHYGHQEEIASNRYNTDVAKQRIEKFFEYVYADSKKNKYKRIYIADCGDGIEGSTLRVSQLFNITELNVEQAMNYSEIISKSLLSLANKLKECKIEYLMVTDSNHSQLRHFNGKPNEYSKEDLSLIVSSMIKKDVKGIKNININDADIVFANINGNNIAFAHGHQFNRKKPIITQLKDVYGEDIDMVVQGHWHNFNINSAGFDFNNKNIQKNIITCPAICGNTDYAVKKGFSSMPAAIKIKIGKDGNMNGFNIIQV